MAQQSLEQIQQSFQALQKRIQTEGITDNSGKVLVKPNAYNPATNVITAENLSNPPKPVDVKPFQEPPLPSGLNYTAPEISQTQSAITPEMQSILDMYEKPTKPDYSAAYNASDAPAKETAFLESQKATKAAQAKLANINAQLQGLSLETQGKELQIGKEPISAGAIRGRNIEEERNLAIRSLPLQAQAYVAQAEAANAQGDEQIAQNALQLAQQKVDKAFEIQTNYENKLYEYNQHIIDKVYDYATEQQKNKLTLQKEANIQAYNERKDVLTTINNLAQTYPDAGILPTDTFQQAQQKAARSPSFLEKTTPKPTTTNTPTSYDEWILAGGKAGTGKTYAEFLQTSGKPATAAQETVAEYAARIEQSTPIIDTLQSGIVKMNPIVFEAQFRLPSSLQSTEMQQYMQAARNFINAKLRRESGAVISPTEFSEARQQYLPQPGDKTEVLANKKANRDLVFKSLKKAAGSAYSSVNDLLGTSGAENDPLGIR